MVAVSCFEVVRSKPDVRFCRVGVLMYINKSLYTVPLGQA